MNIKVKSQKSKVKTFLQVSGIGGVGDVSLSNTTGEDEPMQLTYRGVSYQASQPIEQSKEMEIVPNRPLI